MATMGYNAPTGVQDKHGAVYVLWPTETGKFTVKDSRGEIAGTANTLEEGKHLAQRHSSS